MAVRDLTARNAIEDRPWVRIYIFIFIYFLFTFFSIEFFEGVSKGGPYRWSMDRSVRWSVDPVRWTGPRTGGQCFRVTPKKAFEVDPHSRMQNTSKPGGLTPIVLAVWVCAAVEARAQFQCSGGTTPPKILQNTPPPDLKKERQTARHVYHWLKK